MLLLKNDFIILEYIDKQLIHTILNSNKIPEEKDLEIMKTLLFSTLEKTKIDYEKGKFKNFTPYTTSLKITLSSFEEAISFNAFHEGIHLGYILSMKNCLKKYQALLNIL